ncbi:MAG: 2-amino-4-hydroxy-6-hydroxymethyldihydropteridine diphosphokinase [Cyanobacteria bacterium P01_D01_bin.1]
MSYFSKTDSDRTPKIPAAIALGSNLGDSQQTLLSAIEVIDNAMHMSVTRRSHFYKTAAVGPPQPDYINACITIETDLSPRQLLCELLAIEKQFGRVRKERWGPRSLDLDLLLYDGHITDTPGLTVPHPRLHERPFVLIPLTDIAPNWQHPIFHITVEQCLTKLSTQSAAQGTYGVERIVNEKLSGRNPSDKLALPCLSDKNRLNC